MIIDYTTGYLHIGVGIEEELPYEPSERKPYNLDSSTIDRIEQAKEDYPGNDVSIDKLINKAVTDALDRLYR